MWIVKRVAFTGKEATTYYDRTLQKAAQVTLERRGDEDNSETLTVMDIRLNCGTVVTVQFEEGVLERALKV